MKKKRIWIIIGIIVVLAAGGVYLATRSANSQTPSLSALMLVHTGGQVRLSRS